jgi:hypothetical protein
MPQNSFQTVDYLAEARGRVTELLNGKPIFDRYLQLILSEKQTLQLVFQDLMQKRSIDTATGKQLDIIGDIVGQPRELIDTALLTYFAYLGYSNAASFGDLNNTVAGGAYYDLNNPLSGNTLLSDEQYRLFIKAKVIKNNTNVTPNQLLGFMQFVFGTDINLIVAEGGGEFTLLVGRLLSSFEKVLLNYISYSSGYPSRFVPKPIGVKVNFGEFDATNYFGFQGSPNAKGYGDLSDPTLGGVYAQLI